ncbi:MAG: glycoside hydrolase family 13 protein [Clostridia bacterium]|nr:glycoside hydrolase family 13 protein [Clostridia bacterium]
MNITHHSRSAMYRNPIGALRCNSSLMLRISIASFKIPDSVVAYLDEKPIPMYYVEDFGTARLYECNVKMPSEGKLIWYYFGVEADGETAYYGNDETLLGGIGEMYETVPKYRYQITVYAESFKTPDWMKDAIMYQIFPDRFCREGKTPIHGTERKWGEEPFYTAQQFGGAYLANDFFGGNFKGIEQRLDYLKTLGVSVIYLNPIFKAFSNHRYDTGDYENVDETLGTNADFERLCAEAKKKGIRIILDGVFSHTGSDSRYFNRYNHYDSVGAYQSPASPFYSWYSFTKYPDEYSSWWGFKTLPNTNEADEGFLDYIVRGENSIIKRWVRSGASGWRLDVADELPDEFIVHLRKALKEEDSDALLIGEVWEDASNKISYGKQRAFFWGNELDGVMNYVFRGALLDYLTSQDAQLYVRRIGSIVQNYPAEALYASMNLISSHDVPRAFTVLSDAPSVKSLSREAQHSYKIPPDKRATAAARMRIAAAVQMTMPGVPCIYYGDEIAMEGYADPFNRACFVPGSGDTDLLNWYRELAALRNSHAALRTGDYSLVYYFESSVCYSRAIVDGKDVFGRPFKSERFFVAVNASTHDSCDLALELGRYGVEKLRGVTSGELLKADEHKLTISLSPLDVKIFIVENGV